MSGIEPALAMASAGGETDAPRMDRRLSAAVAIDPSKWGYSRDFNLVMLKELKNAFDAVDVNGDNSLDQEEFKQAMRLAMGAQKGGAVQVDEESLTLLFLKIDANSNGTVDWDEFTNHVLLSSAKDMTEGGGDDEELFYARVPRQQPQAVVTAPHSAFVSQLRREQDKLALLRLTTGINHVAQTSDHHTDMITRITYAPALRAYISGGRDGTVRTWNAATLNPQKYIQNSNKVLGARWVTDVVLPEDTGPLLPLAVLSYDHSISFYDATRNSMDMVGRITNLENVPTCAHYVRGNASIDSERQRKMLAWGDDKGRVNYFDLVEGWGNIEKKPGAAEVGQGRISGMTPGTPYNTHTDWVTKIFFMSLTDSLLSSSMDSTLCLTDLTREKVKWQTKEHINGVHSFAFCQMFNFIATCGRERHVMLHSNLTGKSIGTLEGHLASVSEIVLNESANQLISMSVDKVIKVWDVRYNQCMQTIEDKHIYWPENRMSAMFFNSSRQELVTGTTRLDVWRPLLHGETNPVPAPELAGPGGEHQHFRRPLVQALVSQGFNLLITMDDASAAKVWSVESGASVVGFSADSGQEDGRVSCICLDDEQRRLFTGSVHGDLRIWNFNSGNVLVDLGSVPRDVEITHLHYCEEGMSTYVLAAGDRRIWVWELSSGGHAIKLTGPYHHLDGHVEDIQSMAICKKTRGEKTLVASGGFDGRILLHEISGSVRMQFMLDDIEQKAPESRAIEQLLFLPKRGGTLVAAAGDGCLYFWRILTGGLSHEVTSGHGRYVVTAICSDVDNKVMFTADASGRVHKWALDGVEFIRGIDFLGRGWNTIRQTHGWRAHDAMILSMDILPPKTPESGYFLISASSDGLARMFTGDGLLVGTFGTDSWNLQDPTSFLSSDRDNLESEPRSSDSSFVLTTTSVQPSTQSTPRPHGPAAGVVQMVTINPAVTVSSTTVAAAIADDDETTVGDGSNRLSTDAQLFLNVIRQPKSQPQALSNRLRVHDLSNVEVPDRLFQKPRPAASHRNSDVAEGKHGPVAVSSPDQRSDARRGRQDPGLSERTPSRFRSMFGQQLKAHSIDFDAHRSS